MKFQNRFKTLGSYLLINLISVLFAFHVLGFSIQNLSKPWISGGDHIWVYTVAQNLIQNHSFNHFSNLGWPFIGDMSNWGTVSLFDYFYFNLSSYFFNAFFIGNFYVILGFILVASFTFAMCNKLKFSLISSSALTLLLTLIPWHFQRSLWHVPYANYSVVPIFVLLLISLISNEQSRSRIIKQTLLLLLISTAVPYYWAFAEILLLFIFIFLAFQNRLNLKQNLINLYLFSIIPIIQAIVLITLKSQSIYTVMNSPVERVFGFVEKYSGSFIALLMPSPTSLLPFFLEIRNNFELASNLGKGESGPWNSFIGSLAILFCIFLVTSLSISALKPNALEKFSQNGENQELLIRILILSFFLSLLFYWNTGLGSVFSFLISDWIRSWGRFFIFIVYFAIIITALVLKSSNFWVKSNNYFKNLSFKNIAIVTVLTIALIDQGLRTLPNGFSDAQKLSAEIKDFSDQLDKQLPNNCPVLQLPVMRFPEDGNTGQVNDYDHFWLYLINPDRKFSYGAVKGTQQANWQSKIETKTVKKIAAQAAAVGYCAVVVDFRGYESTVETGNAWIKAAGKPIAVSKNTRLAAFKIDPKLVNKYAQQSLVTLTWKGNADAGLVQAGKQIDFYDNKFNLYALNPNKDKVKGLISFGVRGGKCTPAQSIKVSDSETGELISTLAVDKSIKTVSFEIMLDPLEQKKFDLTVSSKDCTVEWYSDAKISIRNERFSLL